VFFELLKELLELFFPLENIGLVTLLSIRVLLDSLKWRDGGMCV
jgi:hypothetical protein